MQKLSLLRLHNRAWLCRTNAPGPSPTVGAALAVARKPSPLKGEGGWPKARRMRVLSRKVALRARESPSRYPSPAKVPPCQRGVPRSGVEIPFPRDHSRRASFSSLSGRTVCARGPVWDRPLRKDRRASGYAVGAALAAARKPSPLKREGGWPKARRMRVLSRKVALRARESPSRYPSPAKVPPCQRGVPRSGVEIPFPRDHSRRASFSSLSGRTVCARGPVWDRPLRKDRRASGYAVGAALAAARKPSPLKREGGWPKARRMRVLSRKVALRARESPSRYPSPAKVPPLSKGGRKAAWGFPLPEIIHGALHFSLYGRHTWAARRSPAPGGEIPTAPPAPPA